MYLPGAAAATPRPRVPSGSGRKDGSGRQARVSLNQLMLEGSKYGEPSMPMLTKPDGVACQVPGCHANLNAAGVSTYFRRHRVCLSHAKADQVLISGIAMRFCQQCGIMHPLPDFDGSRKSCRVQLDRHNLRRRCRRKTQTQSNKAAAAAAAAAAGGTRNRGGGNPESSSRGGGGSSVSPSGAAGGSPQRGGGGKRAAARAAAAAFAAAAVSGSDGLSDEDSRDLDGERMMGGGYTYGDADYLGAEYGAGAVDPMLDPAAAASMPVHGGYGGYQQVMPPQQQQQGRRGMRKSGSINSLAWEGPGAAAAVAAAAAEPYAGIKAEAIAAAGSAGLVNKPTAAGRPSSAPAAAAAAGSRPSAAGAQGPQPLASPTGGDEAHGRGGGGTRSARESSTQIGAMQAALLRSIASGLAAAPPAGGTDHAGSGGGRQQQQQLGGAGPGASSGAAAAAGDAAAGSGGGGGGQREPSSPRRTAVLLSNLLQQLASGAGKR
ncbi:hypothetical protein OEZ86_005834 [Tetradesmus obliquus]|nr:hypothetical protein OEZ86_005834 [Tetradesmus obliquus]